MINLRLNAIFSTFRHCINFTISHNSTQFMFSNTFHQMFISQMYSTFVIIQLSKSKLALIIHSQTHTQNTNHAKVYNWHIFKNKKQNTKQNTVMNNFLLAIKSKMNCFALIIHSNPNRSLLKVLYFYSHSNILVHWTF